MHAVPGNVLIKANCWWLFHACRKCSYQNEVCLAVPESAVIQATIMQQARHYYCELLSRVGDVRACILRIGSITTVDLI